MNSSTAKVIAFRREAPISEQLEALPVWSSAEDLATLLELTDRRVRQLCELGMPKATRGRYPTSDCVGWYVRYLRGLNARSKISARQRLTEMKERRWTYQAEYLELQLKRMKLRFAKKKEYEEAFIEELARISMMLNSLPGKICALVKDKPKMEAQIRALLDFERFGYVQSRPPSPVVEVNTAAARLWRWSPPRPS